MTTTGVEAIASASDRLRPNKMLKHPNARSWPEHRIELLIDLVNRGWAYTRVARAIGHGATKSAIASQVRTLRHHGDTRLSAAAMKPIDALAEAMANGAPTLHHAARTAGLTHYRAERLWDQIRAQLGPQAA